MICFMQKLDKRYRDIVIIKKQKNTGIIPGVFLLVGATRFELATSTTPR